jgi:iron complex transport system ATP-binding protein
VNAALAIDGLTAGYRNRVVLDTVAAPPVPAGSLCALLGQNGAGKSTLVKALCGLLPYAGTARLGEAELAGLDHRARLERIGYLPQAPIQESTLLAYEYALSTLQVSGGRTEDAAAAIEAVFDLLELRDFALRPVGELSGGKRQLLALACILARRPALMLLDEPTSALDLRWQIEVLTTLRRELAERRSTALICLHDVNLALRFCDTAMVLSGGKIIAAGPAADVITADVLREAYGVDARIEECSRGHPVALVDGAVPRECGDWGKQ